jgi:hypothetical protein
LDPRQKNFFKEKMTEPVLIKKVKSEPIFLSSIGFGYAIDFLFEDGMVFKGTWWENDMENSPFVYKTAEEAFRLLEMIRKDKVEEEERVTCVVLIIVYCTKEEEQKLRSLSNKDEREEIKEIYQLALFE